MRRRSLGILVGILIGVVTAQLITRGPLWRLLLADEGDKSAQYLGEVLQLVGEHYYDSKAVPYPELTNAALRGMVDGLDAHSEFLEPKSYRSVQEEIRGRFGGIGIQVESRQDRVVVIAPVADSPGERAGILRGDEIVRVDGEPLVLSREVQLTSVVDRLRGTPGTSVRLGIHRPTTGQSLDVTIVREIIKVEVVKNVRLIGDGIGYVQISEFAEKTGEELERALGRLRGEGMTSLVLDLRNNPGGLLNSAVAVANQFFRKDELVVYTQGRTDADREEYRASGVANPYTLPIAVLINSGSASAAEIVAGALKDTKRAVIVGERSFGKGSVQTIFRLQNGAGLRLTTARYYTPSGVTINEVGVAPHVEVVMSPEDDRNVRVQQLRPDMTDPGEFRERYGFAPVEDRQLQAAVDVLRGARVLETRRAAIAAR